jgi:cytidine deaminase
LLFSEFSKKTGNILLYALKNRTKAIEGTIFVQRMIIFGKCAYSMRNKSKQQAGAQCLYEKNPLRHVLNEAVMIEKELKIKVYEADSIEMLSEEEQELVIASRKMTEKAYAPYSEFFVGAAVMLENGKVIKGSNQENGAYPSGLCAERVAVFAASAMFPGIPMRMIAVSAKSPRLTMDAPVSPCGACRQVMLEYETLQQQPIKMLLSKENGKILIIEKVEDLLPLSFSGARLKKS